jgi:thimet oligopeptidase
MAIMTAAGLFLSGGCETTENGRSSEEPATAQSAAAGERAGREGESMQSVMTRGEPLTMAEVAQRAGEFSTILATPTFEQTAAQIEASAQFAMNDADRELDLIGALDPGDVTFETTVGALDDVVAEINKTLYRHYLIRETSPDARLRDAARASTVAISDWFVETQYREDLYRAANAFAERLERGEVPEIEGEDRLLFEHTMRDYRRAGLHLDEATRERVAALQKELTQVQTEFQANNSAADVALVFTRAELAGVPETFLEQWRTGPDEYTVRATVTPQFVTVMSNAEREETRRRMKIARYSVNQNENAPLLNEMVRIRDEMAQLLGYATWADYRTETRMAGTGETAETFVEDLARGLEPKFRDEMATFAAMKVEDTGRDDAEIQIWDWRYYSNKLLRERYDVDVEALRSYFPLERVIDGAFDIYGEVFGLTFEPVTPPQKWDETLQLWLCSDAESGQPLGLMYLDLYPRPNKFGHYAQFPVVPGKRLSSGEYQRPVCALVCNFPKPTGDRPSLLSFAEVETYFHELGHALHTMLTTADSVRFSGTSVPRDFVEAPSQMLENWLRDPDVLNRFAADWRDPSKKVPAQTLEAMERAEKATIATTYRRQNALALGDLRIHQAGRYKDVGRVVNDTFAEVFLPVPEGTNFSAYWGHLAGYDAGYYGYAWADAIAADMATVFENAPGGYMDDAVGRRLRHEIFAVGGSRPIERSVRLFLQREPSLDAFFEDLGIE